MSRVYLDFAQWINLSNNPDSPVARAFSEAAEDEVIEPVFSLAHLLDAANNEDEQKRREVATYMEEVARRGTAFWLREWTAIRKEEVIAGFVQWRTGEWRPPAIYEDSLYGVIGTRIPNLDEPTSIPEYIESLRGLEVYDDFSSWSETYPARREMVSQDREEHDARRFDDDEIRNRWIAEDLPETVELPNGLIVLIDDEIRRAFANAADWERWPLFSLMIAFHEGWNLDPSGAQPSDVADAFHLSGAAYSDIAFADSATVEKLRQGDSNRLPLRNSQFEEWLRTEVGY